MSTPLMVLARNAWQDVRYGAWRVLPNQLAASFLVPGHLRMLLLRLAGLDVRSASVRGGCRFTMPHVAISAGVFVNEGCFFEAGAAISIGSGSLLGPNVTILTSNHELVDGVPSQRYTATPVVIGRNCWLGAGSILTPGVRLGDGVTLAAGAVVTQNLTDPGVYAGVPARRLPVAPGQDDAARSASV